MNKPLLALKIDVDTWRGLRLGVPRLLELLARLDIQASFFLSLGPDQSGRALRQTLHPGRRKNSPHTLLVRHHDLLSLSYGTILPAPEIGRQGLNILHQIQADGHEIGLQAWNRVQWQNSIAQADMAWTTQTMQRARQRFEEIFGVPPRSHAATGWQMNAQALRLTQRLGFDYACDSRGTQAYMPVWCGEVIHCPQLPTSLPTYTELLSAGPHTQDDVHQTLLRLTVQPPAHSHVHTLRAEVEGLKMLTAFERLLMGWREQGYTLTTTRAIFDTLDAARLPRCEIQRGPWPAYPGSLMRQGPEFLQHWRLASG